MFPLFSSLKLKASSRICTSIGFPTRFASPSPSFESYVLLESHSVYASRIENDIINLMKQQLNIQWNVYQMSQMGFNAISIKGRENWKLMSLNLRVRHALYVFSVVQTSEKQRNIVSRELSIIHKAGRNDVSSIITTRKYRQNGN